MDKGKVTFRIKKNAYDEFEVQHLVNGVRDENKTYYTDDREDAENTMKAMKEHYEKFGN